VTGLAGHAWQYAAEALGLGWLRTVVIGSPDTADPYGEWWAVREVDELQEAGVLLVRPDGHIAWRHIEAIFDVDAASTLLTAALTRVLGRELPTPGEMI
jgi:2,4-dichlorophenol 6-monooxygenase